MVFFWVKLKFLWKESEGGIVEKSVVKDFKLEFFNWIDFYVFLFVRFKFRLFLGEFKMEKKFFFNVVEMINFFFNEDIFELNI